MSLDAQRVQEVFLAAVEAADAAAREDILARECATDADLRQRVVVLLDHHDGSEGFLAEPVVPPDFLTDQLLKDPTATPSGEEDPTLDLAAAAVPGKIVAGRYRLIEPLGEGGMGAVWKAKQHSPVKRLVALKLIKPGMASRSVLARFEAERQALALMDHPHIAKVLDGGTTEDGCPFFVMELVKGVPLNEYCDKKKLSIADRLELFVQVCQAVQHAHQKGIIHRDIKPTNVLVTSTDAGPVAKVIDFGLAKALQGGQPLTERSFYTVFGALVGSPLYMAPEQVGMHPLDVDTRTDVYSLGVILYELLTGSTPIEKRRFKASAWDEICRLIRNEDPPRPSQRVTTSPDLLEIAATRNTDSERLIKQLRGDLDWIVLKALEKDRSRRYATAIGLALDLQRHSGNEPVTARPPTGWYRFQKMVRRNRIAVTATAAVVMSLILGLGVSTWLLIHETDARHRAVAAEQQQATLREQAEMARLNEAQLRLQAEWNANKAETEATRSHEVAEFMKSMLEAVGPKVALRRDTRLLREILDQTANRLENLKGQPAVEADLRSTLGNVYADLGQYARAEEMHQAALALRRQLRGEEHPEVAASLNDLGQVYYGRGDFAEGEAMHRQALAMRRRLTGDESLEVAESLTNLGESMRRQQPPTHVAEALRKDKRFDKYNDIEQMQREALAIRRKLLDSEHPDVATSMTNLGLVLWYQAVLGKADFKEAEMLHRDALVMRRRLFGNEHPDVAVSLDRLGLVLHWQRRYAESVEVNREALAIRRARLSEDHPNLAQSLFHLGNSLQFDGSGTEAIPMFREALKIRRKLGVYASPDLPSTLNMLAWNLAVFAPDTSDPQEILDLAKEAVELAPESGRYRNTMGIACYRAGDYRAAITHLEKAIEMSQGGTAYDWYFMALAYSKLGDREPARKLYDRSVQWAKQNRPEDRRLKMIRAEVADVVGVAIPGQ